MPYKMAPVSHACKAWGGAFITFVQLTLNKLPSSNNEPAIHPDGGAVLKDSSSPESLNRRDGLQDLV